MAGSKKILSHKGWTRFSECDPGAYQIVVIRDREGNEYLYRAMVTNMTATRGYNAVEWMIAAKKDFDRLPALFCIPLRDKPMNAKKCS